MKRQLFNLLSISLIATSGFVSAAPLEQKSNSTPAPVEQDCCMPCCDFDPCCCAPCGKYAIWGEGLYFRPSSCKTDYALVVSQDDCSACPVETAKEQGSCPDYGWGFRVGVAYFFPCSDFDATVYYSSFNNTSHQETRIFGSDYLVPTAGQTPFFPAELHNGLANPARATSDVKHKWDAVDAEVGYSTIKGCNFSMRGHVGLHWTKLVVDTNVNYYGSPVDNGTNIFEGTACSHIKTWGVGPRFGGDFNYDIGCGLGLVARASWGILAGETNSNYYVDTAINGSNDFKGRLCAKDRCVVFPEFDTALGISYHFCCNGCYDLSFEFGWEFRTYLQSIAHNFYPRTYLDTDEYATTSIGACDPFSMDGLYLRGMVKF